MTLPIERARSRRPITWATIVGAVLLPVIIGGILVGALYDPTTRLDNMSAAIVNDDDPVELNGQTVPLGRQLTAGLVEGSDDLDSNLDWVISNTDDAQAGLEDGTYAAVITIPRDFSAAATSTGGDDPRKAVLEVTTAPDARIVDDAITAQVTQTAASVMGEQLSETYLENVLLGFTTLGDELGTAAEGATELADGAGQLADGTGEYVAGVGQLADGAAQAADGTGQYVAGIGQLADGAAALPSGLRDLASGAQQLSAGGYAAADGVAQLGTGAAQLADGGYAAADGIARLGAGNADLADGISQIAEATALIPAIPQEVVDAADQIAANSAAISEEATASAAELTQLAAECVAAGGPEQICAALTTLSDEANAALPAVTGILDDSQQIADGVNELQNFGPEVTAALEQSAAGAAQLADGASALSGGVREIADGTAGLAAGAQEAADGVRVIADGTASLASGADQAAAGSQQLASGAQQAASQGSQLVAGTQQLAGGAQEAAEGGEGLVTGTEGIADGTEELSSGLQGAVEEIPSYTDDEAQSLASVVSDPVVAEGTGTNLFGASAVPLLAMLALWFGGLATFVALQAVTRRALSSRAPSALLALRGLAPAAAIGAVQGLLVAGVVQLAATYTWTEWSLFALLCIVAGVAFAAVHQALVAVFGGMGRWIAALVGVLALATQIVSTVPGALAQLAVLLPTSPAYSAMLAALTPADGVGAGVMGLVTWMLLAFVATIVALAARRRTSAAALTRPSASFA